ncbi:MAG: FGGY-family carbohydrate kinase [Bilifractor sp.]|jgi:xylulokinase
MILGGLDIGTTGCKLTVYEDSGKYLGRAYREYPAERTRRGHTIDASVILDSVYDVMREIGQKYPDLAGIGVTSFGETFVMTDAEGRPLAKSLLYTDPHGTEQRKYLEEKLGSRHIQEICGSRPYEMFSLPKLMWMRDHHPEICRQTKHVFLMQDFVVWHLTHRAQIDYSLAARTMGLDIRTLRWSTEIFEAAGIDQELFALPVPSGTPAGPLTWEAAQRTGLPETVQIISCCHDQVAAAVGGGVFSAGTALDGAGTVQCITPFFDRMPDGNVMYEGNFPIIPYVLPGSYVTYAFETMGGALLEWCTKTLAKEEGQRAKKAGMSVNAFLEQEYLNEGNGREPGSLLVLPHFAGAATPYMDAGSRGVILGLTSETTVADIYHGCMEGVVYEMMVNIEALKPSGISFRSLAATGGGARSSMWMQMKADMLNLPVTVLETVDAGTTGSAMLTGIALGCFRGLQDAAERMIVPKQTFLPDSSVHGMYAERYLRYRELYHAVRPLLSAE